MARAKKASPKKGKSPRKSPKKAKSPRKSPKKAARKAKSPRKSVSRSRSPSSRCRRPRDHNKYKAVYEGKCRRTAGGLTKKDLTLDRSGKVVSVMRHAHGYEMYRSSPKIRKSLERCQFRPGSNKVVCRGKRKAVSKSRSPAKKRLRSQVSVPAGSLVGKRVKKERSRSRTPERELEGGVRLAGMRDDYSSEESEDEM